MDYFHFLGAEQREQLKAMTLAQLWAEEKTLWKIRCQHEQEGDLLDIKKKAIEKRLENSDPISPDFEKLAVMWRKISNELERHGDEAFRLRLNYNRINDEISQREYEAQHNKKCPW